MAKRTFLDFEQQIAELETKIEELRYVILHELLHLRRMDVAVSWALSAVQTLHWFNPLVWFAASRIKEEPSDPLRHLPESNPFSYVERLLMVQAVADDEGIRAHVIPFPVNEPELWPAYVPRGVTQYLRLFSEWGGTKLERMREAGYEVYEGIGTTGVVGLLKGGENVAFEDGTQRAKEVGVEVPLADGGEGTAAALLGASAIGELIGQALGDLGGAIGAALLVKN